MPFKELQRDYLNTLEATRRVPSLRNKWEEEKVPKEKWTEKKQRPRGINELRVSEEEGERNGELE